MNTALEIDTKHNLMNLCNFYTLNKGCTNPRQHVAWVTIFCMVVPNRSAALSKNLLHVTFLVPKILKQLGIFGKFMYARFKHVLQNEYSTNTRKNNL